MGGLRKVLFFFSFFPFVFAWKFLQLSTRPSRLSWEQQGGSRELTSARAKAQVVHTSFRRSAAISPYPACSQDTRTLGRARATQCTGTTSELTHTKYKHCAGFLFQKPPDWVGQSLLSTESSKESSEMDVPNLSAQNVPCPFSVSAPHSPGAADWRQGGNVPLPSLMLLAQSLITLTQ